MSGSVARNYGVEDAQTRSVERLLQMTKNSPAGYRRKLPDVIKIAPSSSESASKSVFRQKRSVFKILRAAPCHGHTQNC